MSKPSLVIVVVEDGLHKQLVNRYLKKRGLEQHAIRIEISTSGDASAWVRKRFAKEVRAYRSRKAKTALIVVIDADTGTVQERWRQLDQALKDAGIPPIDFDKEQIARLVPKRNIETWILCLNGQTVDEKTDYKKGNDWSKAILQAAETLYSWTQTSAEPPQHCVDSLRRGVGELRRLNV
jgi:hypothetical protein